MIISNVTQKVDLGRVKAPAVPRTRNCPYKNRVTESEQVAVLALFLVDSRRSF